MGTDMSMFQISSTVILDSMKAFLECALHAAPFPHVVPAARYSLASFANKTREDDEQYENGRDLIL